MMVLVARPFVELTAAALVLWHILAGREDQKDHLKAQATARRGDQAINLIMKERKIRNLKFESYQYYLISRIEEPQ